MVAPTGQRPSPEHRVPAHGHVSALLPPTARSRTPGAPAALPSAAAGRPRTRRDVHRPRGAGPGLSAVGTAVARGPRRGAQARPRRPKDPESRHGHARGSRSEAPVLRAAKAPERTPSRAGGPGGKKAVRRAGRLTLRPRAPPRPQRRTLPREDGQPRFPQSQGRAGRPGSDVTHGAGPRSSGTPRAALRGP